MATFNYSSKSSIKDNLTEILVGAGLIIVPVVYPFGIININILQYDRNRTVGKDDNLVMEQVY